MRISDRPEFDARQGLHQPVASFLVVIGDPEAALILEQYYWELWQTRHGAP
jgi:hypothetical protein